MIPAAATDGFDFEFEQQPTKTYHLNREKASFGGYCDGKTAMEQLVYKILHTERYEYLIYSWNYGVELQDLYGQPLPFVYSEVKRRISEALLQDERITAVGDFTFSHRKGNVLAQFAVQTTEGEIAAETEVAV